jgi:hypothetical protein
MKMFSKLKRTLFKDFPNFIRNIWKFRKALWSHHWWDYAGTLEFLEIGISDISKNIEKKGNEIKEHRLRKVEKMNRVVEILTNIREERYFDLVEQELGKRYNNTKFEFVQCEDMPEHYEMVNNHTDEECEFNNKFFARVAELEEEEWNELWQIVRGQNYEKFDKSKDWEELFDGSGIKCWWD